MTKKRPRRYKIKCVCYKCNKLRIVTPLYPTTKAERTLIAAFYECPPNDPDCRRGGSYRRRGRAS